MKASLWESFLGKKDRLILKTSRTCRIVQEIYKAWVGVTVHWSDQIQILKTFFFMGVFTSAL